MVQLTMHQPLTMMNKLYTLYKLYTYVRLPVPERGFLLELFVVRSDPFVVRLDLRGKLVRLPFLHRLDLRRFRRRALLNGTPQIVRRRERGELFHRPAIPV